VFERFTERARQVVVLAQDEARALKHNYIGTEHLLLGLLREEEGLAARVLESLDVTVEEVRAQVARIVGQGDEATTGQVPFTPRAKKVLELSLREGLALGHNYIGTEHILLGLARENEGVASRILLDFGADAETIRNEVLTMLSGPRAEAAGRATREPYEPKSPPFAAEFVDELARIRSEKEAAIERQEFDEAARLRDRERRLRRVARELEHAWETRDRPGIHEEARAVAVQTLTPEPRPAARKAARRRLRTRTTVAVPVVWLIPVATAAALAFGIVLGWAVWG
jgi:ATP-dependent Clp protease ATP-binding subunit ClpA